MDPSSPTSTSRPLDVIHVTGVPRPSLFFAPSASVYYTERKPKNKKRGRPGNEATSIPRFHPALLLLVAWKSGGSRPAHMSNIKDKKVVERTSIIVHGCAEDQCSKKSKDTRYCTTHV